MTGLIEDRLRAHFADRAARDVLPGPEADVAVERARQAGARSGGRAAPRNVRWLRRPRVLLAAAVVVAIAAAGVLIATDDPARVTTDPSPAPTSPDQGPDPSTTPSTEPTTPSTSETTAPPPAGDRPTGPIVSLEGVLGTWSGSEWVPWDAGATPGDAGDGEYRIVRLDEPITSVVASGSASPMACAEAEHAVQVAEFGPLAPNRMDT